MLKQLYVQQIDIQLMQNITRQLRDNQSRKNNSIPLSALTYNAPAGYAPLTKYKYVSINKYIYLFIYIYVQYIYIYVYVYIYI